MKKKLLVSLILFCLSLGMIFASEVQTSYYKVIGDVQEYRATEIATALDAYWEHFNSYFHFNPQGSGFLNEVLVFPDKIAYDTYLREKIKQTRDEFVFLKYSSAEKSKLVIFDLGDQTFNKSFARQAFLQYLYSFIKNPPIWLREGFAIFVETAKYNPATQQIEHPTSLAWLETAKNLRKAENPLSVENILNATQDSYPAATLYPQAWSLVYYFVTSPDKDISRLFWDSLYQLSTKADLKENTLSMAKSIIAWLDNKTLTQNYDEWLSSLKTWNEFITSAIAYYEAGEIDFAENTFKEAIARNDAEALPFYYLGLISYEQSRYAQADNFYKTALEKGAAPATVNWALGVNSFADNRLDDALNFIQEAENLDPEKYSEKATELRTRIEAERSH